MEIEARDTGKDTFEFNFQSLNQNIFIKSFFKYLISKKKNT